MSKYLVSAIIFSVIFINGCDNKNAQNTSKSNAASVASQSQSSTMIFPVPPAKLDMGVEIKLDVSNTTGRDTEYLWWVKAPGKEWTPVGGWSNKSSFTYMTGGAGVYNFQVDYRANGKPEEVTKKWLGQTIVGNK